MPKMNSDNNTDYMAALSMRGNNSVSPNLGVDLTASQVIDMLAINNAPDAYNYGMTYIMARGIY